MYVDGIRWTRVDTLFNAGPQCQVYIVREDAEGKSIVQFGDGKTGARLSSGRDNVTASYRIGLSAYGTLKAGSKPQATGKLTDLDKVFLPVDVTTGADPELAANARLAAPAKLQSLGRLVSIADWEAETCMLPNVLKASARWDAPEGMPLIALTVLTQSDSEVDIAQIRNALTAYGRCRGPARHPVLAINGYEQFVHVDALIGYEPSRLVEDITKAVKLSLGVSGEEANNIDGKDGLFGLNRRDFHQSIHTSEIIAAIQNVPGVVWVQLRAARNLPHTFSVVVAYTTSCAGFCLGTSTSGVPNMSSPRLDLYKRLPEIYRIRDAEQVPAGQLEAYVGLIDAVHSTAPFAMTSNHWGAIRLSKVVPIGSFHTWLICWELHIFLVIHGHCVPMLRVRLIIVVVRAPWEPLNRSLMHCLDGLCTRLKCVNVSCGISTSIINVPMLVVCHR